MIQISLEQSKWYGLGEYAYTSSPNAYNKTIDIFDGTGILPFVPWDYLKEKYGIEIVLTKEEEAMVERGRTTWAVAAKAEELGIAIDAWLLSEKAR